MEIQEIKKFMKEKHITYAELSEKSNLSISTIKKIFSGYSQYPRIDTMQAIESALGLSAPQWTDEEKALGVGNHKTVLSDEEWTWIETLENLKQKKGEDTVKTVIQLINTMAEK